MKIFIVLVVLLGLALCDPKRCETPRVLKACAKEMAAVAEAYKAKDPKFLADMKKNADSLDFKTCKKVFTGCEETACEIGVMLPI